MKVLNKVDFGLIFLIILLVVGIFFLFISNNGVNETPIAKRSTGPMFKLQHTIFYKGEK